MKTVTHWHVVREEIWEDNKVQYAYHWHQINLDQREAQNLERMRAEERLIKGTRTVLESMRTLGSGDAQLAQLLQRKLL